MADVDAHTAVAFTVPFDAPAPLPAGDPAIIVRLADGSYVAFDAVCTHAGCTVEWDAADASLACPCHGAVFDPQHGGAAVVGPAQDPLASIPIVVDPASGRILLKT
jgi:thiosulfate dehydrogenase [quinone] large subunit